MKWMMDNLWLFKMILVLALLGTITFTMFLSFRSILPLTILGIVAFFYAFKFRMFGKRSNLRDLPVVKIFLIGLVWAVSCVLIPAIESNSLSAETSFIAAGFFLYIVGITIPFDIRDIDLDEVNKKTIPQLLGIHRSKLLAIVLLLSALPLMGVSAESRLILLPGILFSILLVILTKKNADELFFSFGVDGLLILLPVSYWLLL